MCEMYVLNVFLLAGLVNEVFCLECGHVLVCFGSVGYDKGVIELGKHRGSPCGDTRTEEFEDARVCV